MQASQLKSVAKRVLPAPVKNKIKQVIQAQRNRFAKSFYDPSDFPFTAKISADWRKIRKEAEALTENNFQNWPGAGEKYQGGWGVFAIFAADQTFEENCRLCPETARLAQNIPDCKTAGFSMLLPHSRILPHTDFPPVLRFHLGLVIPEDCGFRVGKKTRGWKEGEWLAFDDSLEHEAWNNAATPRIILGVDIFMPGAEKRKVVSGEMAELVKDLNARNGTA